MNETVVGCHINLIGGCKGNLLEYFSEIRRKNCVRYYSHWPSTRTIWFEEYCSETPHAHGITSVRMHMCVHVFMNRARQCSAGGRPPALALGLPRLPAPIIIPRLSAQRRPRWDFHHLGDGVRSGRFNARHSLPAGMVSSPLRER